MSIDLQQEVVDKEINSFHIDIADTELVEMSVEESKFLLYLLKKKRPQKILEIGVAAGGTSKLILENMEQSAELFSVDTEQDYYRDESKTTGFVATEGASKELLNRWKTYFGFDVIDCIEEIGGDIDFLIMDTVHALPGEFLSFLAVCKYLKQDCVVVLHDIALNYVSLIKEREQMNEYNHNSYCNALLLSAVSTNNKIIISDGISNIGAFIFNDIITKNILYVILPLFVPWYYMPTDDVLVKYTAFIKNNFPEQCLVYFYEIIALQHRYANFLLESKTNQNQIVNKYRKFRKFYIQLRNELEMLSRERDQLNVTKESLEKALHAEQAVSEQLRVRLEAALNKQNQDNPQSKEHVDAPQD